MGGTVARADVPDTRSKHASIDDLWAYDEFESHLQGQPTLTVISAIVTGELPFPDTNDDVSG